VRVFDLAGKGAGAVPILPVSAVGELVGAGDDLLFRNTSYIDPPGWYRYAPATGKTTRTALFQTSPADYGDAEVLRDAAVSADGTRVPLNILRKKGTKLDGQNPTLLRGYGGYAVSRTPRFSASDRVWLDHGGVMVVANLRGGGEFGEAWHQAGALTKKQNVFDDFAACARRLVAAGYTKPERLAIMGGSNGGLLMGAALTQHPELYRAVVSYVGIYDMLRVELTPNGAFNVTEFGTVKDPKHFEALFAYSPLHHVENGATYPSILFLTGANDPRVDPFHSRKMTARLQAASGSARPVLLRTSDDTGHGIGTPLDAEIEEDVDVYAFLFHELGML
jgi:prolyl oligopeptidase